MSEERPQNDFEKIKLHEQKLRQIESAIISVRDLKELQSSWEEVNLILEEVVLKINPIVWDRFLEWYKYDRNTTCKIAQNSNPSIPSEVFENLSKEGLKLDGKEIDYYNLDLFKALCIPLPPRISD